MKFKECFISWCWSHTISIILVGFNDLQTSGLFKKQKKSNLFLQGGSKGSIPRVTDFISQSIYDESLWNCIHITRVVQTLIELCKNFPIPRPFRSILFLNKFMLYEISFWTFWKIYSIPTKNDLPKWGPSDPWDWQVYTRKTSIF